MGPCGGPQRRYPWHMETLECDPWDGGKNNGDVYEPTTPHCKSLPCTAWRLGSYLVGFGDSPSEASSAAGTAGRDDSDGK